MVMLKLKKYSHRVTGSDLVEIMEFVKHGRPGVKNFKFEQQDQNWCKIAKLRNMAMGWVNGKYSIPPSPGTPYIAYGRGQN